MTSPGNGYKLLLCNIIHTSSTGKAHERYNYIHIISNKTLFNDFNDCHRIKCFGTYKAFGCLLHLWMGVLHWITRARHFVIFVSIWHHLRSKQHTQLNYHRIQTSLTESFHWLLSASSVCHPSNVVWEDVCDGGNEAPTTPLRIQCVLYDVITY